MKAAFRKIFSLFLGILLVTSSISWTVGRHYCGHILVDVSLFHEAEKCGMEPIAPISQDTDDLVDASCCSDDLTVVTGQDHVGKPSQDVLWAQQLFLSPSGQPNIQRITIRDDVAVPWVSSPPFTLVKDIHLLCEVFLI
ncbi:MAG: hypothetical protein V7724_16590 [Sediminicola sp.]